MEQNKFLIPLAIVLAGGMVSGAIYFGGGGGSVATVTRGVERVAEVPKVTAEDHIRGSIDAPVVIVEYSDTECPFCKVFHNTMKTLVAEYEGEVAWVYRHFPIAQLHARAHKEAEATECAAELGGKPSFWNYIDEVFERTNSNDSLDPAELPKIAQAVGLNVDAFNTCLNGGKYTEYIQEQVEKAVGAGALGTPHSIIIAKDGRQTIIQGAEPIESIRAKIDALLK